LPAYWEDEGLEGVDGVVWFRKEIDVPASMTGKRARLLMGRVVDSDSVYINGKFIGTISYQYPPRKLGLYNGMIAPLLNYGIKGVIWYQGESNTWNPNKYRKLFPALIKNWRKKWNQGDFPFLFVQLHNFMETKDKPSESNWALLREAQLKTLSVPNTGMVVAIDIGEWNV